MRHARKKRERVESVAVVLTVKGDSMAPVQKSEDVRVRMTPELRQACEKAAKAAGLTLSDWIRSCLSLGVSDRWLAVQKFAKHRPKKETE